MGEKDSVSWQALRTASDMPLEPPIRKTAWENPLCGSSSKSCASPVELRCLPSINSPHTKALLGSRESMSSPSFATARPMSAGEGFLGSLASAISSMRRPPYLPMRLTYSAQASLQ